MSITVLTVAAKVIERSKSNGNRNGTNVNESGSSSDNSIDNDLAGTVIVIAETRTTEIEKATVTRSPNPETNTKR